MNRKFFAIIMSLLLSCVLVSAQESAKSSLQQRAEEEASSGKVANARSLYIRAFEDYASKGQMRQSVECGAKATALYYRENLYHEAFEFLHRVDQAISNSRPSASENAALRYYTAKERMQMYMKMKRAANAKEFLNTMENLAATAHDDAVSNDLLYSKAVYYYTFGLTAQGNAVFKEMAAKLTADKEYDKVEEAYKTLIANGRRSNSASLVAQSYSSYIAWKDSVDAIKVADERAALKKQIADNEATIAEKDSSLTTRQAIIIGLAVLAAILAAALVLGAIVLMRFILLTRKQKKTIKLANENNALKAKFISNISAQLEPTLRKIDGQQPEIKALLEFSNHIQTLSDIENSMEENVELEETSLPQYCEALMDEIRNKVRKDVELTVNVPKMCANINRPYVSHIIFHLLSNAAEHTPEGGHITLEFKKRSVHKFQFLVSNTGESIPEEQRDELFKPFREVRDLTTGDGLGLPICKQMALKMKGDLEIDPQFTKGTRFVLDLFA
jgi:signal transduction histidine kinase